MIVADLQDRRVFVVRTNTSLADAEAYMNRNKITGLSVVDPSGNLIGVVTLNDVVRRRQTDIENRPSGWPGKLLAPVGAVLDYLHAHTRQVAEIMTADPAFVAPHTDIENVSALMRRRHIKRLPVVRDGKLVGMITKYDLLAADL